MKRILATLSAAVLVGAVAASPALATNGMEMIGTNPRSTAMGGADVAADSDAAAVSGNPALICGCAPSSASIGFTALMPKLDMTSMGGANDLDGESQVFLMPQIGYVHRLGMSPFTAGLGLYAQGGMGVDFQGVNTGMGGAADKLTSQVAFMRLNPILAYQATEWATFGATVMLGYAQMKFDFFPNTYSPGFDGTPGTGDDFAGMKVRDLTSFGVAGRLGAQFKLGPQVRLGATYTTKTDLQLDSGSATLNFGQANAKYDAELGDFTWPQEFEVGIAYLPVAGLTLAADAKWINWSDAIKSPALKLSNPDIAAPPSIEVPFAMNWDDQWVFAVGAEYVITPVHTVRCGYNYGKSPVPDNFLNPLFPATVEHHLTVGYGATLGKWVFDLAFEHAFENRQTNQNQTPNENPFGPGLEVGHSQNTITASATYRY